MAQLLDLVGTQGGGNNHGWILESGCRVSGAAKTPMVANFTRRRVAPCARPAASSIIGTMPMFQNVQELLTAMVRIDSVSSSVSGNARAEAPLGDMIEQFAGAQGWPVRRLPVEGRADNILVTCAPANGGRVRPWLLLESHMDTVSVDGMTIDPFGAEIRDGRIWGRGACDTKGTGASMLWALKEYDAGPERPNNIGVLFTVEEEVAMTGAAAFARTQYRDLSFAPRGIVVGEPTLMRPVTAHNGVVRWEIHTRGVATHSADPSRGCSAISAMVKVIEAIESRYIPSLDRHHPLTGKAQCSINIIQGGKLVNIVPDHCRIELDRRVVPGEDPDRVLPAVQKVLDELKAADPQLQVEQELKINVPPLSPCADESLLVTVQNVLRRANLPTEPAGVPYGTDASALCETGVPVLVLGPGNIAQAHTRDEWLDLDQLQLGVQVYRDLMRA